MITIQINDPWFESLYKAEFGANPKKFLNTFKTLLSERNKRNKKIANLLNQYKESEISIGKIAEKLNIDRETVLTILAKHNIDLVDYSWNEEEKNIENFLLK